MSHFVVLPRTLTRAPLHLVRCSGELLAKQKPELVRFIVRRVLGPDRFRGNTSALFKQDTDDPLEQAAYSLFYEDCDRKSRHLLARYIRRIYTLDYRTGQVRCHSSKQRGWSKVGDSDDDDSGDDSGDDDDDDSATDSDGSSEEASDDESNADWSEPEAMAAGLGTLRDDEMHCEAHEASEWSNSAAHASIRSTAAATAADDDLLAVEKRRSGQAQRQQLSHHHHHHQRRHRDFAAKRTCGSNIASDGPVY